MRYGRKAKIWQGKQQSLIILLVVLLACAIFASIFLGVKDISLKDVLYATFSQQNTEPLINSIVHKRLIRTIFGLLCGSSLGVAAAMMQSVTRNPLADPSILGINTGAAFFVVLGIAFWKVSSAWQYITLALIGACVAAILVFGIIAFGRKVDPLRLILSGTAVGIMFSSLVTTVILIKQEAMDQFRFWQVGSLGAAGEKDLLIFMPIFVVGVILAWGCAPALNTLLLGEDVARNLGVNVIVASLIACISGVVLCAVTTAFAGPIAFIGLLATHCSRLLFGSDQKKLVPLCGLTGALFLTIADVIGRLVSPSAEINVGTITALVGAPLLIYLARRMKVRAL